MTTMKASRYYIPIGWLESMRLPWDLYPNFVIREGKIPGKMALTLKDHIGGN